MDPATAATLKQCMIQVVQRGTGTAAQIPGITVAGKTGTAETGTNQNPHAWFIAFAPADNPQYAIAVLVEHGGTSGIDAEVNRRPGRGAGRRAGAPCVARDVTECDRTRVGGSAVCQQPDNATKDR